MEVIRYKYIFILLSILLNVKSANPAPKTEQNSQIHTTTNCPYTKIIEDIFKIHNRTSDAIYLRDREKAKIFLNSIANVTTADDDKKSDEEELVDHIIASINKIKNNLTTKNSEEAKLNEAIILNVPENRNLSNRKEDRDSVAEEQEQIKSGIQSNIDAQNKSDVKESFNQENVGDIKDDNNKTMYVLTIEPNNTANNYTSNNIIEVLKHLMPIFNNTLNKELHNITIIEKNQIKNHSYLTSKNVSTIVVTYCDKENYTKANVSFDSKETILKVPGNMSEDYEYYFEGTSGPDDENYDEKVDMNMTIGEKRDLLEAAEYGMQKMHELYTVLEPKLYSMGLWLDDTNPARYVAAFNAPTEDVARYSRYGYASVQAAAKLKELTGGDNEDGLQGRTEDAQAQAFPISALRQSPLQQQCPLKGAPKCPPASKRYRTHDGTCNNLNRPRWGSIMTPVQRFLHPSYSDGIQAPRRSVSGLQLPSAREISALVHEDQNVENPGITHLLMQWGQFLDHDVTSSSQSRGFNGSVPRCCKDGGRDFVPKEFLHPECFPIPVPPSDPFYGPRGVRCLDFVRSSPAPRDDCALGWREQLNQVSAYIDGSPVYGSSARQSDKLRLFRNGMLQYGRVQQHRPLLPPERKDELCRGGAVSTDCFKSGDARVNEHPGLVAAHIVWLRQHNRMAQELAHLNPHWSDEKIYQETRKIIGAMIQHITYREFLPIVLGSDVMRLFELEPQRKGHYRGYDPKINASPASSFGSAAFRFGHSLVQPSMMRYDRFHRPMHNNVSLHNEITNPSNIWSIGAVDRLLLGMVNQPIQKRDEFITEELTNHLFQTPSFGFGMDLAAINIQRGRDHGVPPYSAWREPCGLTAIQNFQDLFKVMPARAVRKLQTLYRSVDDIDLFTGGMAERPVVGGLVGPTFACIIAQQFSNLRKGDRFWYENGGFDSSFTPAQLQQIRRISFAQVLCHTLDTIDSIQPFVFLSPDNPDNGRISCSNGLLNDFDLSPWVEINTDFNNDISKTDNQEIPSTVKPSTRKPITRKPTTQRPKKTKTTTKPTTTTKKIENLTVAASNKVTQKKPAPSNFITTTETSVKRNKTDDVTVNDKTNNTLTDKTNMKPNVTVQNIDDKLDFKNKSRRYEDTDRINTRDVTKSTNKQYSSNDYDEEENVQSVQSVVINNLAHRPQRPSYNQHNNRPYNYNNNYNNKRPVITVTENIDKYTYLINYVPRPTESWRHTTRRTYDKNVVKVTYQNYDDTYRRPTKPYYYNRDEYDQNYNNPYRRDRPNTHIDKDDTNLDKGNTHIDIQSSARSNDDTMTTPKPKETIDKSDKIDNFNPTTENLYKLVTFGYVGTYKGSTNEDKNKQDLTVKHETISKDFSTYDTRYVDIEQDMTNTKLSTFFLYETATKPYSNVQQRPTRRNDDDNHESGTKTKYYYIKNVLHKLPGTDETGTITEKDIIKENYNNPGHPYENIEERSSVDKLAFLEEAEKAASAGKQRIKIKKPSNAKTPSVAFQVIPSENNPSQWAVYDEKDLPEGLPHRMPSINTDPHALKEVPRPMKFGMLRKRRPWF